MPGPDPITPDLAEKFADLIAANVVQRLTEGVFHIPQETADDLIRRTHGYGSIVTMPIGGPASPYFIECRITGNGHIWLKLNDYGDCGGRIWEACLQP